MSKQNETKHEKFVRLAESRVNRIEKELELLGNLARKENYEYSQEEVEKIFKYIDKKYKKTKDKFKNPKRTAHFSLKNNG